MHAETLRLHCQVTKRLGRVRWGPVLELVLNELPHKLSRPRQIPCLQGLRDRILLCFDLSEGLKPVDRCFQTPVSPSLFVILPKFVFAFVPVQCSTHSKWCDPTLQNGPI